MKLRLENGNFGIKSTWDEEAKKDVYNSLPKGLKPIDFLGVIVESRDKESGITVTYSEIGEAGCPVTGGDGTVYDDVIYIVLSNSVVGNLFYNKTTGDIGTDLEEIANKSESSDTETEQNPGDQGNDGR